MPEGRIVKNPLPNKLKSPLLEVCLASVEILERTVSVGEDHAFVAVAKVPQFRSRYPGSLLRDRGDSPAGAIDCLRQHVGPQAATVRSDSIGQASQERLQVVFGKQSRAFVELPDLFGRIRLLQFPDKAKRCFRFVPVREGRRTERRFNCGAESQDAVTVLHKTDEPLLQGCPE